MSYRFRSEYRSGWVETIRIRQNDVDPLGPDPKYCTGPFIGIYEVKALMRTVNQSWALATTVPSTWLCCRPCIVVSLLVAITLFTFFLTNKAHNFLCFACNRSPSMILRYRCRDAKTLSRAQLCNPPYLWAYLTGGLLKMKQSFLGCVNVIFLFMKTLHSILNIYNHRFVYYVAIEKPNAICWSAKKC